MIYQLVIKGSKDAALRAVDQHLGSWYCVNSGVLSGGEALILAEPVNVEKDTFEESLNRWVSECSAFDPPFPPGALVFWSPRGQKDQLSKVED